MTTRAAVNILGSTGEIIDVTSLGVSEITSFYNDGIYRIAGTLGMAPPPMGWGYVVNQADTDKTISIAYTGGELQIAVEKDGARVKLEHSITLHVLVEELPPVEMPLPPMAPPESSSDPTAQATSEYMRLRTAADFMIAPLQDAIDLEEATDDEVAIFKVWRKYRVALNRVSAQPGYPITIDWPIAPA